jgi:hypothetical protein
MHTLVGVFVFAARSFIRPKLTCPVSDEITLATDYTDLTNMV